VDERESDEVSRARQDAAAAAVGLRAAGL
jgi:hypothetical protein